MISISKIRIDGGTQARAELNQSTVSEYAEAYRDGVSMPPVAVFYDGSKFWLADGFHRYFGAKQAGLTEIYEERIQGTLRDAILYSLKANETHGLRRSNADKRKAVETLLADAEWVKWSDNAVSKACCVSRSIVESVRGLSLAEKQVTTPEVRSYTTKHGTTATMQTANIGTRPPKAKLTPSAVPTQSMASTDEPIKAEYEALREQFDELGQNLKETIEENESMGRVFDSSDQVSAAMAEAKRFREMNRVLESRLTGLTNELNELKRLLKSALRRAEKAEAALPKEVG
jgi:hypothetical protein